MRIGLDIDDTISKTWEVLQPSFLQYYNLREEDFNRNADHYAELLGIEKEEYYGYMTKNLASLVSNAEVKPYCKEVLNRLKEKNVEIILITVRARNMFQDPEKTTKEWLEKMEIPYDKLFCNVENKLQICKEENIDVFIDDSVKNCIEVSKLGIPVFLMNSVINQQNTSLKRVCDWLEIEKLLQELE